MVRLPTVSALLLLLSSCATPVQYNWVKPGATSGEGPRDKYACLQEAQQRESSAYVNNSYGAADSQVVTNTTLFGACMNARGWYLMSPSEQNASLQNWLGQWQACIDRFPEGKTTDEILAIRDRCKRNLSATP
jgi:hypothetical protein